MRADPMSRLIATLAALLLLLPGSASSQTPVSVERDVIFSRTQGSAVLADLAYPMNATEPLPAIVYVHGGRWRAGSRINEAGLQIEEWAGRGFFAMTVDYRLVGATPAPAPYQDVLTAVRWVHAHADDYGVDPDRIYLIGNSSGGHLVSLVATLGDGPYERIGGWEDARSDVRAVISAAGPYDLNALSWGELWTPLEGDPEEARRIASPIHQIGPGTRPILIIHSDDDRSVPVEQAVEMAEALESAGVEHRFVHYADRGHMSVTDAVIEETLDFIAEVEGRR